MLDLPPLVASLVIAAIGTLLYLFAWVAVKEMPAVTKWLSRIVLAAIILVPTGFLIWQKMGGGPLGEASFQKPETPIEQPAEKKKEKDKERRDATGPGGEKTEEPKTGSRDDEIAKADDGLPNPGEPGGGDTRGLTPDASKPETTGADKDVAVVEPTPRSAVGESNADWKVIPVFYGTDRERKANEKRDVDYGSDRGRRLEIGRALVTVPKAHEVPEIERPWSIVIPYFNVKVYEQAEDPKKHFTMQELKALSQEEFLALVRERLAASKRFKDHALLFVHGFNTQFDYAIYRSAQIAYDMKFDGAPFVYSWPSGGGVSSYTYDRESAAQAEPYLREFIQLMVKQTGARTVSIIAHSMGNQPLLRVLQDLSRTGPEGVRISQLILAAPDVDRDAFEGIVRSVRDVANGVTLYAASNDRALEVSRRFHGGVHRAGDVPDGGTPVIIDGIDTIDVTAASTDALGINHSGYAENNALLNDIGLLVQTGERPPEKRIPILKRITTDKGDFWRYPPSGN